MSALPTRGPARVYKVSPGGRPHTASPPDSLVVCKWEIFVTLSSFPQFSRTTSRTKYGKCGFGVAERSSGGTAGVEGCPGDGAFNSSPDGQLQLDWRPGRESLVHQTNVALGWRTRPRYLCLDRAGRASRLGRRSHPERRGMFTLTTRLWRDLKGLHFLK